MNASEPLKAQFEERRNRNVNIVILKQFILKALPENSHLMEIILAERDELKVDEFLAKMDLWLKLFNAEFLKRF